MHQVYRVADSAEVADEGGVEWSLKRGREVRREYEEDAADALPVAVLLHPPYRDQGGEPYPPRRLGKIGVGLRHKVERESTKCYPEISL